MFEVETKYYEDHKGELRKLYDGKHLIINGGNLYGAYDTFGDAVDAAMEKLQPETFMIKDLSVPDDFSLRIWRI